MKLVKLQVWSEKIALHVGIGPALQHCILQIMAFI